MAAQALAGTAAVVSSTAPSLSAYSSRSLQDTMFAKLKEAYPLLANAALMDYLYAYLQDTPTMEHLLGSAEFYSASDESWNDAALEYWSTQ